MQTTRMGRLRGATNYIPASLSGNLQSEKIKRQRESSARLSVGEGSQRRKTVRGIGGAASNQRVQTAKISTTIERANTKLMPTGSSGQL